MCLVKLLYLNEWVLSVVAVNIQLELVADTLCVDGCCNSVCSFVKQCKYGVVRVVVN